MTWQVKIAKILITGATGFIGSHILETLINIQHPDLEVVAACRAPAGLIKQFSGEVRQGDLRDTDYLDRVLVGIDIVCHTAGWSSFEKSGNTANQAYLEPTLDLINHAIEWRISRFINLSSIYVMPSRKRNNINTQGTPRAYWPMINCLIAVENYLKDYQQAHCQFINLRLGLYSGKRLNMGLIPLLLSRSNQSTLPYISDSQGYLPLVDGHDIGQAFARAALGPIDNRYTCLNITGPSTPSQADVMRFINEHLHSKPLNFGLPSFLAKPLILLQGKILTHNHQSLFTHAMLDMLQSPTLDNQSTAQQIGYDPEISWQASLLNTLERHKNQSLNLSISQQYSPLNI